MYDRVLKEVTRIQLVTVAIICEKFKVNGSVARKITKDLVTKGLIKVVGESHKALTVYTGTSAGKPEPVAAGKEGGKGGKAAPAPAAAAATK